MPRISSADSPAKLRPYLFHGIDLAWEGTSDALGHCPFCKSHKFFVDQEKGLWQCKICGGPSKKGGGNTYSFLQEIHKESVGVTQLEALEMVAEERRIPVETLQRWGLVQSLIDREWLLPGYGTKNIITLYRWSKGKEGKRRLMVTAETEHALFGIQFWDANKPDAYILEGPWDAMTFEVAIRNHDFKGGKTIRSGNKNAVLYSTTNVVASPGCEQFKDEWVKRFADKNVTIIFDSDYPKRYPEGHKQAGEVRMVRGKPMVPGFLGMEATAKKLYPVARSIRVVDWGGEGFDSSLPDGFDVRDCLTTEIVLKKSNATTTTVSAE